MRWIAVLLGSVALAAFSLVGVSPAQQRSDSGAVQKSGSSSSQYRQNQNDSERSGALNDDEIRVRYNDDNDRLHFDVDQDVQFGNDQRGGQDRGWTRDGDFELRYDTDRNLLRLQGEGAIDMNRIGADVAHWWQTWWDRERQNRRSAQEGVESGARTFISQYDDDRDNFVSRNELPASMRDRFEEIDLNGDNYLSYREIRSVGAGVFNDRERRANRDGYGDGDSYASSRNQDDQSWSEWWSSWWSDESQNRDAAAAGADRLLRQYDTDDSGYLSRAELPSRMRNDFDRVDRNHDNYLSRSELSQHGDVLRDDNRTAIRTNSNRTEDQTWNDWWDSWFEENPRRQPRDLITTGAGEFIRRHDQNGDGYLVRSEMPYRMYDYFNRIDRNGDRYLTRSEIESFAAQSDYGYPQRSSDRWTSSSRTSGTRQPVQAVSYWIIDVDEGQLQVDDVQQAYTRLLRIDADHNGKITSSELKNHRMQEQDLDKFR